MTPIFLAAVLMLAAMISMGQCLTLGIEAGIGIARLSYEQQNIPSSNDWFENRVGKAWFKGK